MNNVEDMEGFEIDTGKNIYVHFVSCKHQLFIYLLNAYYVLNEIVEIASVCPMPMEEDPSTVVLNDVE